MLGTRKSYHELMYVLLSDWRSSALSKRDYCLSKGIRPTKLNYWLRKQRRDSLFKEEPLPLTSPSSFLPIELISESSSMEAEEFSMKLHYPNGVTLEISSLLSNPSLMELIKSY